MAKLIVNPTSSTRREISLGRSLLSIGRDPSNDLVLPDAMVSRRHAVIEYRGSQYYIRDCNSSNGSLVNGDRVSERTLRDGDLVAIGTARLLFRDDVADSGAKVVQHPSSPRLECASCQADYRKGDLFCRECGAAIAPTGPPRVVCASCGTAVLLPARFCNACGARPEPGPRASRGSQARGRASGPASPAPRGGAAAAPRFGRAADPPHERGSEPRSAARSATGRALPGQPRGPRAAERLGAGNRGRARPAAPFPPSRVRRSRGPGSTRPPRAPVTPGARAGRATSTCPPPASDRVSRRASSTSSWCWRARRWSSVRWPTTGRPSTSPTVSFLPVLASLTLAPLSLLLGAAYFIDFWGWRGATPGKDLLDLRVTDEDGPSPIGLARAALRFLGYVLSAASLGIGFVMIAATGDGLHDRVAGTRVLRGGSRKA